MTSTTHRHTTGPGGPRAATLAFFTPAGRRRVAPVRLGPESRRDPLLPQLVRNGLLDDEGQQCVQVRLTTADAAHPGARELLDTEARTALSLHRALDDTEYAGLFPRIIGHDLDAAEPFLLYAAPRGTAAARTHVMSATDQRGFTRDLLQALYVLERQGLVPCGVSPATVLWDGASAQLWGLEGVARTGRPGGPGAGRPTARPNSAGARGSPTPGTRCGAPPRCSTSS